MGWLHTIEDTALCCPVCWCLGYCAKQQQHHDGSKGQRLIVIRDRSYDDFGVSAKQGCTFCDATLQSFMLLQSVEVGMPLELVIYAQSPTELHSLARKGVYDVVEIYPSSGTPSFMFFAKSMVAKH